MSKVRVITHYNYLSMRRVDPADLPSDGLPKWYNGYNNHEFIHESHEGHDMPITMTVDLNNQIRMGVLINATWRPRWTPLKTLAQYCAFPNLRDMTAYIDIISKSYDIITLLLVSASGPRLPANAL